MFFNILVHHVSFLLVCFGLVSSILKPQTIMPKKATIKPQSRKPCIFICFAELWIYLANPANCQEHPNIEKHYLLLLFWWKLATFLCHLIFWMHPVLMTNKNWPIFCHNNPNEIKHDSLLYVKTDYFQSSIIGLSLKKITWPSCWNKCSWVW